MVAMAELDPRIEEIRVEPKEETQRVPLIGEDKVTRIGTSLSEEDASQLNHVLQANVDVFTWTAMNMLGIDPAIITHKLSTFKDVKSVAQKKRRGR